MPMVQRPGVQRHVQNDNALCKRRRLWKQCRVYWTFGAHDRSSVRKASSVC